MEDQQDQQDSAPESPRLRALRQLSNQLPVANAQVAAGQQAARDIQLQQAVQQARPAQATAATAQDLGASMQANAGTQMVEQAKQSLQAQGQIASTGLAEQSQQARAQAASSEMGLENTRQDQVSRFAKINADAKKSLFDDTVEFRKDEMGRTILNERQLADYAKLKATNENEFKDYAQKSEQLGKRKLAMMNAVQQKLELSMKQEQAQLAQINDDLSKGTMTGAQYANAKQLAAQKSAELESLAQMKADYLTQIGKQTSSAAARMAQNSALGGIVGAVIGGVVGGVVTETPMGAAAGAAAGQAGGQALGAGATQQGII